MDEQEKLRLRGDVYYLSLDVITKHVIDMSADLDKIADIDGNKVASDISANISALKEALEKLISDTKHMDMAFGVDREALSTDTINRRLIELGANNGVQ